MAELIKKREKISNGVKKFYITTSIAYTNAPPHIGFALECIQADVLARYHRSLGEDVFFLTGTDEHGIKIAKAAKEAGKSPHDFVDEISAKFKKLKKFLNLSSDDFIRTTNKERHWSVVEKVWKKLEEKGDIYKEKYQGFYCSGCEAFITERTKSSALTRCLLHPNLEPILIKEENYFFKLSKYAKKIREKVEKDKIKIVPQTRKNEILEILNQKNKKGLEDISFSRSAEKLKWGISVPGDKEQIIYVWADALTNYISALEYPNGEKFKKYWPADIHCIGKDILKFHALIWPVMLLSLGLKLPKNIFVHGFISVNGQKMSKSLGNVIDPFELVKKYGTDPVRYYLLREIPATEDGDFSYEKFEQRYNSDLASGIGNLVARISKMAENQLKTQNFHLSKFCGAKLVAGKKLKTTTKNPKIKKEIEKTKDKYKIALGEFKFNEALKAIWDLISFCDKYIEQTKPWETKKSLPAGKQKKIIKDLLLTLDNIADLLEPFLPETSKKIRKKVVPLFPRLN